MFEGALVCVSVSECALVRVSECVSVSEDALV